ncbi:MAG: hypothetical protein WCV80_02385 [Candidatus Paceibacterota bacterium]|jgi:hypothetical protein
MKIIIKFFISTIITVILLEVGTRILVDNDRSLKILAYNPHEKIDFDKIVDWVSLQKSTPCSLKPGSRFRNFIVNSHGFVSEESSYAKPNNTYRTLLLGDSFAVGVVPYKLNFFKKFDDNLKDFLSSKYNLKIQGINLGISCVGPAIYKKAMDVEGVLYKPNLVILSFFVGNDFTDDSSNLRDVQNNTISTSKYPSIFYKSTFLSVLINSVKMREYLASSEYKKSQAVANIYGAFDYAIDSKYDPFLPSFDNKKFLEIESGRLNVYGANLGAYNDFNKVIQRILDVKKTAESINARFLVVIIPDELQVNNSLFQVVTKHAGLSATTLDIHLPQKLLKEVFEKNGIRFLDPLTPLREKNKEIAVFQPRDTHLNSFGNEVVANTLTEYFHNNINFLLPSFTTIMNTQGNE